MAGEDVRARFAGTASSSISNRSSIRGSALTLSSASKTSRVGARGGGLTIREEVVVEAAARREVVEAVGRVEPVAVFVRAVGIPTRRRAGPSESSTLTAGSLSASRAACSAARLVLVLRPAVRPGTVAVVEAVVFFSTTFFPPGAGTVGPPFLLLTSPNAARFRVPSTCFPAPVPIVVEVRAGPLGSLAEGLERPAARVVVVGLEGPERIVSFPTRAVVGFPLRAVRGAFSSRVAVARVTRVVRRVV